MHAIKLLWYVVSWLSTDFLSFQINTEWQWYILVVFSSELKITDEISYQEEDLGDGTSSGPNGGDQGCRAVSCPPSGRVAKKKGVQRLLYWARQPEPTLLHRVAQLRGGGKKMETRLDTALGHCSEELVGLVYRINGRAMPPILVKDVKNNYGDIIKQDIRNGVVGTVSSEKMVRTLVSTVGCLFWYYLFEIYSVVYRKVSKLTLVSGIAKQHHVLRVEVGVAHDLALAESTRRWRSDGNVSVWTSAQSSRCWRTGSSIMSSNTTSFGPAVDSRYESRENGMPETNVTSVQSRYPSCHSK